MIAITEDDYPLNISQKMAIISFPPVDQADEDGLLAVGGDLEVESLLLAYRSGVFPWPISDEHLLTWFAPSQRAIVWLKDFHISQSLKKFLKKTTYEIQIDTNFSGVIQGCADIQRRKKEKSTWITDRMIEAYTRLHQAGYCHSIECYDDGQLVGGLYGVSLGAMFAGESMFHLAENASKVCVCHLVERMRKHGAFWFDCQQMTPLFKTFGAVEIERSKYMKLLEEALLRDVCIFS